MQNLKVPSGNGATKEYKLCIFGEASVGKTSLARQFVETIFLSNYDPSVENVYKKTIKVDEKVFNVEILDTAGTENFAAMRNLYIDNSHGFVLVYSITSQATLNSLHDIYHKIMNNKKQQPAMVLVGNKVDLANKQRTVGRQIGQELADRWMCPFLETSAKTSKNVDEVFIDLVRQIEKGTVCRRRASRQEDMPRPVVSKISRCFCCPFPFFK